MREAHLVHTTQRLVAFALTVGLMVGGFWVVGARSDGEPADLAGLAKVVDGDTLVINGTRVRLEGIDAPEAGQACKRRLLSSWACGTEATGALARVVQDKQVRCEPRGLDKYGRTLGVCFLGQQDVNAWMVRQGYAWAFIKYSTSYVKEETEARDERIGIWQGEATPPWEYRENRWASAEPQAPQGCAIKGNVTAHGKIYHMPWSPWYAEIRMDPERGRRWFCTERGSGRRLAPRESALERDHVDGSANALAMRACDTRSAVKQNSRSDAGASLRCSSDRASMLRNGPLQSDAIGSVAPSDSSTQ